ncbi:hypothetical protein GA0115253_1027318 [Streptomyces sp. Termitarium-T10T-6]|nr:hypothetical protein GA0115253_1027318 [Streptomyces sp. Termitarium-T10T-6]
MGHHRTQDVQLHGGGPGTEHHAHPRGLRLGLRHLLVAAGPGAPGGGQPVGEETTAPGALQVERAAQKAGGERGGDPVAGVPVAGVVHGLSLSAGGRAEAVRQRSYGFGAEPDGQYS